MAEKKQYNVSRYYTPTGEKFGTEIHDTKEAADEFYYYLTEMLKAAYGPKWRETIDVRKEYDE